MIRFNGFLVALCVASVGLEAAAAEVWPAGSFPADPPNREWARIRRFEANSPLSDGSYGEGVALSGDVLAVGSPGASDGTVTESGLVEVWVRGAAGWEFSQYLVDPTPVVGSLFGASVDACSNGRFIIVGAPEDGRGRAYVYTRQDNGTWSSPSSLSDPLISDGAKSGYDVAIDCDGISDTVYAVVGAPFDDVNGTLWSGSLAIWHRGTNGVWTLTQRFAPHAGVTGARCGHSVDLSYRFIAFASVPAARLLFGCTHVDYSGFDSAGVAYVYDRSGSSFSLEQTLGPPDPAVDGEYGTSVALLSGNAVVGAPWAPHNSIGDAGRLWVWQRTGAAPLYWESTELTVDDFYSNSAQYFFGSAVAIGSDSRGVHVFARRQKTLYVGGGRSGGVIEVFSKASTDAAWVRSDRLASPDVDDGYDILSFGGDLAAYGGELAVGAERSSVNELDDAGTAFVFSHERVFGGDFETYVQTE